MPLSKALGAAVLAAPLLCASAAIGAAIGGEAPATVHPDLWPAAHSPATLKDSDTERQVDRLLAHLSVEEKVGQVIQADISAITPEDLRRYPLGSVIAGGNSGPNGDDRASAAAWLKMIRAFHAISVEHRPGHTPIPVMFGLDAVHGDNNIPGATLFPHNIGLGAARDPQLMRQIGQATAEETAVIGADWTFGPTLAVPRDVRWGRTYEGYGENPEIVRAYAPQMVTGVQGVLPKSGPIAAGHVAASIKHFLADGGTSGGKDQGDSPVTERELIDIHSQGYPPAIDAGALTVMASFSSWQGVKNHGDRGLLTGVLKGRMGFQGFIVGDWNAHGQIPGCTTTDCPAAMNAGLDMYMAPDSWKGLYASTLAEVRSGVIPTSRLDDAVRRILRVKIKAGLFAGRRPFEGRFDRLGAPEHRALARRAVRESLVLLKNNGSVLPIRSSAHVLVAGHGADNIGQQAGGWTISWQGADNKNADFPHAQSIGAAIVEAVRAGGGQAEIRPDAGFSSKPDVAIVVFGEEPYAEFEGDTPNLDFHAAAGRELALMKRLKAQGIPVVAVFLSGRPMWVNPEINAADAFVAAWLPGSEGGGVADVLVGKRNGKPRFNFRGRLSYAWPATALPVHTSGPAPTGPAQFAYGYGLTYVDHRRLPALPETAGAPAPTGRSPIYFRSGKAPAPWSLTISDAKGSAPAGTGAASSPGGLAQVRPIDAGAQESGKAVSWRGNGEASLEISGPAQDLVREANGDMAVALRYRIDEAPSASVFLSIACGGKACARLDISRLIAGPVGSWRTVKIKLACFRESAADLHAVTSPLILSTSGRLGLSFDDVALVTNTGDAVCP